MAGVQGGLVGSNAGWRDGVDPLACDAAGGRADPYWPSLCRITYLPTYLHLHAAASGRAARDDLAGAAWDACSITARSQERLPHLTPERVHTQPSPSPACRQAHGELSAHAHLARRPPHFEGARQLLALHL